MKKSSTRPRMYGRAMEVWATVAIVRGIPFQTPLGIMSIAVAIAPSVQSVHRGMHDRNNLHALQSKLCIENESSSTSFENSRAIQDKRAVAYSMMNCETTGTTDLCCCGKCNQNIEWKDACSVFSMPYGVNPFTEGGRWELTHERQAPLYDYSREHLGIQYLHHRREFLPGQHA
jgi:hypothetical protein